MGMTKEDLMDMFNGGVIDDVMYFYYLERITKES